MVKLALEYKIVLEKGLIVGREGGWDKGEQWGKNGTTVIEQ